METRTFEEYNNHKFLAGRVGEKLIRSEVIRGKVTVEQYKVYLTDSGRTMAYSATITDGKVKIELPPPYQ